MPNKNAILEQLYTASEDLHTGAFDEGRYGKYIVILQEIGNSLVSQRISPDKIQWPVMCFGEQEFFLRIGSGDPADRYYFQPQPNVETIKTQCVRYSNGVQTFWMIKHHLWMLKRFEIPNK